MTRENLDETAPVTTHTSTKQPETDFINMHLTWWVLVQKYYCRLWIAKTSMECRLYLRLALTS